MRGIKTKTRRLRFWWHLTFAYALKYRFHVLSAILTSTILIFTLYKITPIVFRTNLVTIGYVGSYTVETIPAEILSLATQPLIGLDQSGKPIPSIASNWTVADGGKTYIVFLKDNLKWHDDTNVTAKDISIAIANVQITALNNKTLQFKLPNPISSFPVILNKPVFKTNTFYGTGQFRIVSIDKVDNIVKKISLVAKDKNLPRVEIKFYPTENQAKEALKIGDIKKVSVANAKEFEKWPNLQVTKGADESEVVTIFYNTKDGTLSDKDLRQSLTYAINKSDFDGEVAFGPYSPSNWAFNPDVKKYEYNPAKAKELLSKSQSGGPKPKITLTVIGSLNYLGQQIKKDWETTGVDVEVKTEKSIPKQFQALLAIDKIQADPDQYTLWHSSQASSTNITSYKNIKIDKLLEDARTTQDEKERKQLYQDFQKFLVDDAPAAFLYYPNKYQIEYKNVEKLLKKLPAGS